MTYSVLVPRLASDDMERFIRRELDAVVLPHAAFTPEAFGLIVRSAEGYLSAGSVSDVRRPRRSWAIEVTLPAVSVTDKGTPNGPYW